jgi:large subunit ribosomal protein L5
MYFKEKYTKQVLPELMKSEGYANVMQAPKIEKIVLNM